MTFRLFGSVEVVRDGAAVELGAPKQRAVLALLLLDAGRVVSTDRLIEGAWGEQHQPASATAGLHVHISRLRALLRDDASATSPIVRRPPGYLIDVEPDAVDVTRFRAASERAQSAADTADWATVVEEAQAALALWRGPLVAEHADEQWVRVAAVALEERRTACQQNLVVGLLGSGRVAAASAASRDLYDTQPLHERACWLRMIALHRNGQTARGLDVFREYAARLDEELALQPGPALRDLQGAMLRQAPELDSWPHAGSGTGPPGVVEPRPEAAEPAPAAIPDSGIVGRHRELAVIDDVVGEAGTGAARWLLLTGEAGIGKSRLAEEAARRWTAAGGVVSRATCPDDDGVPAWWPIRQLLRDLGADPEAALAPPPDTEVDQARFAVYERVVSLLADTDRDRPPLMVLVDDVHWADRASLRFLAHLADARLPAGLAVVLTVRDGVGGPDVARVLAGAARRSGTRHLAVPPLSAVEGAELAGVVSGGTFDAAEAASLASRTGGNPFFISEYARLPADERALGEAPQAVRSVVGMRLSVLDPAVLQVARTAAIIGDLLDIGLLADVTRLDRDELADLLDDAADEHIIVPAPGSGTYTFAHALMRDARRERLGDAPPAPARPHRRGDRPRRDR